jgi:hypothetical protein
VRRTILSLAVVSAFIGTTAQAQISLPRGYGPMETDESTGPTLPPIPVPPAPPKAQPDEVSRGDTVLSRQRPDYDPIGQRVGGFILYSDLDVQETYNSNVFYTPSNDKGDFVTAINPSVDLKSNWNQHALNFHGDLDEVIYSKYNQNNFFDYTLGSDGRLDVYHDARIYGGVGYAVRHLPLYSPNNIANTQSPVQYSDTSANLAGEKEFNRLSFRLDTNYDRYEYKDAVLTAAGGGGVSRQSLENYDEEKIGLKTGYEFVPGRQVYLLTAGDFRNYDNSSDLFGFNRTSSGYTVAVGAKYDLTGVTFIDGYIGYRHQSYDDARLPAMDGPAAGLQVTWNVTRLTTVTGSVTRDIQETILAGASGYFATLAQVKVDHELLRNLLLNVSVGFENDNFTGISRNDDYYLAGFGAKYLINHNFWASAGYNFAHRDSDVAGTNFDDHIVNIRLSAHL